MNIIKTAPSIPQNFDVEEVSLKEAKLIAGPFEPGCAVSVAHPLRRFLLCSSVGYALVGIKIDGASHEFDNIRGMLEDVSEFIINLKSIRFKIKDENKDFEELNYSFKGPKQVSAKDLSDDIVDIVTEDNFLTTLNEDAVLNFSVLVYKGIGYISSEDIRKELSQEYIPLDAYFTPVRKVTYNIENVLVDDNPNYEKIIFNILTDGQVSPIDAFKNALEVLYGQLAVFSKEINITAPIIVEKVTESSDLKQLMKRIDELAFSARSFNCLDKNGIKFVGEISIMSENDLKNVKNLGKKSLDEIRVKLEEYGFPVGCKLEEELLSAFKKKVALSKGEI